MVIEINITKFKQINAKIKTCNKKINFYNEKLEEQRNMLQSLEDEKDKMLEQFKLCLNSEVS
jgi:uncharacterized coiled-coil DUF342 family protein